MRLAERLLAWYEDRKRELPWRKDKDPYKIWVSEVMLQQTRVEAVKPYFARWMERFPTLESLAAAKEEEVTRYWQGLGYYSRARNLLQGVREVSESYGGQVPESKKDIIRLSGIGDYTAGAILSIAYDKKEVAIDGNVLRVFSRLYCVEDDISSPLAKRIIRELVEKEISETNPGEFNQALMDLGATICIPKTPRCELCPLQSCCCGKERGVQGSLPIKKKKTPPRSVCLLSAVIRDGDSFLLRQRSEKGLLAKMWEFPTVEIEQKEDAIDSFRKGILDETGQEVEMEKLLFQCTHTFSHRQWDISFYYCSVKSGREVLWGKGLHWVNRKDWGSISFAGPHRKMEKILLDRGSQDSLQYENL
jgi:A/G-specific adenine glycosylase